MHGEVRSYLPCGRWRGAARSVAPRSLDATRSDEPHFMSTGPAPWLQPQHSWPQEQMRQPAHELMQGLSSCGATGPIACSWSLLAVLYSNAVAFHGCPFAQPRCVVGVACKPRLLATSSGSQFGSSPSTAAPASQRPHVPSRARARLRSLRHRLRAPPSSCVRGSRTKGASQAKRWQCSMLWVTLWPLAYANGLVTRRPQLPSATPMPALIGSAGSPTAPNAGKRLGKGQPALLFNDKQCALSDSLD